MPPPSYSQTSYDTGATLVEQPRHDTGATLVEQPRYDTGATLVEQPNNTGATLVERPTYPRVSQGKNPMLYNSDPNSTLVASDPNGTLYEGGAAAVSARTGNTTLVDNGSATGPGFSWYLKQRAVHSNGQHRQVWKDLGRSERKDDADFAERPYGHDIQRCTSLFAVW